jgi:hypothetical protein
MARHVPSVFIDKIHAVQAEVAKSRGEPRCEFQVTTEVLPGVRLVKTQHAGTPIVFSLWTEATDVAEICGDAAYPATAGLLAIDKLQIAELGRADVVVAIEKLTRSESAPGLYYELFDYLSHEQLRKALALLIAEGTPGH